jgi:acyl carrier protein
MNESIDSAVGGSAVEIARRYVESPDLDGAWFAIGGSSLDAARLISALDQELGVTLSLRDLLCADSVHDCLAAVDRARAATPDRVVIQAAPVEVITTSVAGVDPAPAPSAADLLWPALAGLPADERIRLAHSLLSSVVAPDSGMAHPRS